jgi:hypothetical protein
MIPYPVKKHLGLLVTSPDHPEELLAIARSARSKDIVLQIHLIGSGVLISGTPAFAKLLALCRVCVCLQSALAFKIDHALQGFEPPVLLPFGQIADLLFACERRLVF